MALVDYDLHKLGWRAFQDLCAVILQQVLGQTFHTFADSNDAGRDGAFHGQWAIQAPSDPLALGSGVATVAQCKFSAQASGTLTPSTLVDEITKVGRLHSHGLCDAYLLLTNLSVTGRTDEWLKEQVRTHGVQQCLVLDGRWICQQISQRPDLRRYVPRIYGLGDLGQILDDRRLRQAQALLSRLEADLATFVPTEAYRRAADAVADHGFVLLLGEPACGKSTIAATLAMAALDNWGCGVRRVDSAEELIAAWNPDEPSQLFWVDDAFGGIRHDAALTDSWSRRMDQVMTAVKQGARVILTSRDYIYRDARPYLKEYAYPRLRERKVVIDVTDLTDAEKRQILYNHLKAGDQPRQVLEQWRPHLCRVAGVKRFQPEVARRLSRQTFTQGVRLVTDDNLVQYFERPVAFLSDVLHQPEPGSRGALACVYLSGDELAAPVQFTPTLAEAVTRLGTSEGDVLRSFPMLDATFLQQSTDTHGDPVWRFRHPTIREGFAAVIAEDANAVTVFLDGLDDHELLQQIDCGGATTRGTLVRVPASQYARVIPRVTVPVLSIKESWSHPFAQFLLHRCSPVFLREWAVVHDQDLDRLLRFGGYIGAYWEPRVLGRLQEARALPETLRRKAVEQLEELALELLDAGWLDESVCQLFTDVEREELLGRVRDEILPNLNEEIDMSADGYSSDVEPEACYQAARDAIAAYKLAFANDSEIVTRLDEAERYVEKEIENAASDDETPPSSSRLAEASISQSTTLHDRDEFDDIAEGR